MGKADEMTMSTSRPTRLTSAPTAAEGGWVRADRDAPRYDASASWSRKIGMTGFPIEPGNERTVKAESFAEVLRLWSYHVRAII